MPSVAIVASAENTCYQMWQAMLFHYSCLRFLGQAPIIVVHHNGQRLLAGFDLIVKRGGQVQAAPNYRSHKGVSYPPRNTAGTLRHVTTDADFIFLCDADMLFLRPIRWEDHVVSDRQLSFDEVNYLIPKKAEFAGQLETICQRAGITLDTLLHPTISGGVPHMLPRRLQHAISQDWFDVMEFFPTFDLGPDFERPQELREVPQQFWTTTMWALVITMHRLELEPVMTRHCLLNARGDEPWPHAEDAASPFTMLHYCYSHPGFDKRQYHDVPAVERTVWNLPEDDGTVSGAIRGQLRAASTFYKTGELVWPDRPAPCPPAQDMP